MLGLFAGGFTAVLWQEFFAAMEARFGAPRFAFAEPFSMSCASNGAVGLF